MSDELGQDPFGESEDAEPISEAMVKKATWLIHILAERRGADYKEIQKKCKKLLGYENLAKVTLSEGHAIINKLIELTGGEEGGETARETKKPEKTKEITKKEETKEETKDQEKGTPQDEDMVTSTMRNAVRAAVDITMKEVVDKDVPVQGLGGFVLEIGKVLFEAKMAEEASK